MDLSLHDENKRKIRLSRWTYTDTIFLMKLANSKLKNKWTTISKILGNKTASQCHYHYKKIKSQKLLNVEEDDILNDEKVIEYFKNCRNLKEKKAKAKAKALALANDQLVFENTSLCKHEGECEKNNIQQSQIKKDAFITLTESSFCPEDFEGKFSF